MNKNWIKIAYISLGIFVSGCSSSLEEPSREPSIQSPISKGQSMGQLLTEAKEGDFVLQIVADKRTYGYNEPVKIKARLKYVGELSEVDISHAASAFSFFITETTRDIGIGYIMNQPLIHTQLKKGEWLEESYTKTGGYGETDPHREFIKQFVQDEAFPIGEYDIVGQASFTFYQSDPEKPETKEVAIHFQTKPIQIKVE